MVMWQPRVEISLFLIFGTNTVGWKLRRQFCELRTRSARTECTQAIAQRPTTGNGNLATQTGNTHVCSDYETMTDIGLDRHSNGKWEIFDDSELDKSLSKQFRQ